MTALMMKRKNNEITLPSGLYCPRLLQRRLTKKWLRRRKQSMRLESKVESS